jgi:deazaflavin-dependent oxidoreductase (nitroreductase family)
LRLCRSSVPIYHVGAKTPHRPSLTRSANPPRPALMRIYRNFFQRLGHMRWFAVLGRYAFPRIDRMMHRLTGGKLVPTGTVAPVLLLTTTGRRSGRPRTTPVIFIRDGQSFVITSQDLGSEKRRAAWPLNLDANPDADVKIGPEVVRCRARRVDDGEAARYWPRLVEVWPAHETYLKRSGRRHTFRLEPLRTADGPYAPTGPRSFGNQAPLSCGSALRLFPPTTKEGQYERG